MQKQNLIRKYQKIYFYTAHILWKCSKNIFGIFVSGWCLHEVAHNIRIFLAENKYTEVLATMKGQVHADPCRCETGRNLCIFVFRLGNPYITNFFCSEVGSHTHTLKNAWGVLNTNVSFPCEEQCSMYRYTEKTTQHLRTNRLQNKKSLF